MIEIIASDLVLGKIGENGLRRGRAVRRKPGADWRAHVDDAVARIHAIQAHARLPARARPGLRFRATRAKAPAGTGALPSAASAIRPPAFPAHAASAPAGSDRFPDSARSGRIFPWRGAADERWSYSGSDPRRAASRPAPGRCRPCKEECEAPFAGICSRRSRRGLLLGSAALPSRCGGFGTMFARAPCSAPTGARRQRRRQPGELRGLPILHGPQRRSQYECLFHIVKRRAGRNPQPAAAPATRFAALVL